MILSVLFSWIVILFLPIFYFCALDDPSFLWFVLFSSYGLYDNLFVFYSVPMDWMIFCFSLIPMDRMTLFVFLCTYGLDDSLFLFSSIPMYWMILCSCFPLY